MLQKEYDTAFEDLAGLLQKGAQLVRPWLVFRGMYKRREPKV